MGYFSILIIDTLEVSIGYSQPKNKKKSFIIKIAIRDVATRYEMTSWRHIIVIVHIKSWEHKLSIFLEGLDSEQFWF